MLTNLTEFFAVDQDLAWNRKQKLLIFSKK